MNMDDMPGRSKYTQEEKEARKEFFRLHGAEIRRKERMFEEVIKQPILEPGLIPHPALVDRLIVGSYGYMPNTAIFRWHDPGTPLGQNWFDRCFVRIDHVVYNSSEAQVPMMRVERVEKGMLIDYSDVEFIELREIHSKVLPAWPALVPVIWRA